jgi:hypothetical protein
MKNKDNGFLKKGSNYSHIFVLLNPFLPTTIEHLSYLSKVVEIWILEFHAQTISRSVKAKSDIKGTGDE